MARPALSASRGLYIIDLLSAFPERGFTLSEIARATKINMASCRTVLSALAARGYLASGPNDKTYMLGPALIAAGQAALKSQSLIARAQRAAETLYKELGIPVSLTTLIGDEIVALVSISDVSARSPGMRVGERMPNVPPLGAPHLAWSSEEAIETWNAKKAPYSATASEARRESLALTRERGFHITMRSPGSSELTSLLAEVASRRDIQEYKAKVLSSMQSLDPLLTQPNPIMADELYDVGGISAPIFNQKGDVAISLSLRGFSGKITGAMIERYSNQLIQACMMVMRAEL